MAAAPETEAAPITEPTLSDDVHAAPSEPSDDEGTAHEPGPPPAHAEATAHEPAPTPPSEEPTVNNAAPTPANGGPTAHDAQPSVHNGESGAVAKTDGADAQGKARFRVFIIDTGWSGPASKVLHANLPALMGLTRWDPIYVLDHATSVSVMRDHIALVGRDPIITVHDLWAMERHGHTREHGFRMHLGILHDEDKVLAALKMFAGFLTRFRMSRDLEKHVHRHLRSAGLQGAIEIVGGTATHTMELVE